MAKFSDQLRQAVKDSGLSRYAISARTGIEQSTLSLFVKGKRGLSLKSIDELADCLWLEIKVRRKSKRKDG
jgi:transcriptional regulator with XRE-family HTH domain